MKDKALIAFSTYNQPWFLEHCVDTFQRIDPGYPCDLLIWDNSNTDSKSLKLLEQYSKKYRVQTRPNIGRAQGSYNQTWQENKDHQYYFFCHDDVGFIRDGWLKLAVDRINDDSIEPIWKTSKLINAASYVDFSRSKVGKVGFQAYEWGTKYNYFRTGHRQIFHYMDPVAEILKIHIPTYYQHINDDKILYSNECLQKIGKIWNIEDFWTNKAKNDVFEKINKWFVENGLENYEQFQPTKYTYLGHKFQTVSEFLNDISPALNNFRTHCVIGDGYCQEEAGWGNFRGNEFIVHYGDHVVFKRLSLLFKQSEEAVRARFKDKTFLTVCDNIIKKECQTSQKDHIQ
jgi:hypothetical protein